MKNYLLALILTYSFMNCTLAGTMNVYKDSTGQVLLSKIDWVQNFKNFYLTLLKSTQYDKLK